MTPEIIQNILCSIILVFDNYKYYSVNATEPTKDNEQENTWRSFHPAQRVRENDKHGKTLTKGVSSCSVTSKEKDNTTRKAIHVENKQMQHDEEDGPPCCVIIFSV